MAEGTPFSKRYYQHEEVELPEPFRRRVLYVIDDSFKEYRPDSGEVSPYALVAADVAGRPKGAVYASVYLHDIVVREEGFPSAGARRGAWLGGYALACPPAKFLDILDYLFGGWLRDCKGETNKINALLEEYGLPYAIKDNRVEPVGMAEKTATQMPVKLTPSTPFANRTAMRNLVRSCSVRIWWLERHMPKKVLEVLNDEVDSDRVREIKLLSGPKEISQSCKSDFEAFAAEMKGKGVTAEWRVLNEETAKQLHDRYIITEGGVYNVPPINSVFQRSQLAEISSSLVKPSEFEALWLTGTDIVVSAT